MRKGFLPAIKYSSRSLFNHNCCAFPALKHSIFHLLSEPATLPVDTHDFDLVHANEAFLKQVKAHQEKPTKLLFSDNSCVFLKRIFLLSISTYIVNTLEANNQSTRRLHDPSRRFDQVVD